mgnify:CR=1 FL=1
MQCVLKRISERDRPTVMKKSNATKTQSTETITPFDRLVYLAALSIPKSKVCTYGDLAAAIGKKGAARAVGSSLARNPYAPEVPCHRIVRKGGHLAGYQGKTKDLALKKKSKMLATEKVAFKDNGSVRDSSFVGVREIKDKLAKSSKSYLSANRKLEKIIREKSR